MGQGGRQASGGGVNSFASTAAKRAVPQVMQQHHSQLLSVISRCGPYEQWVAHACTRACMERCIIATSTCRTVRTIWYDKHVGWRQACPQHCVLLGRVADADDAVHVGQHALEQLVGEYGGGIGETKQRVVRENHLVAQMRRYGLVKRASSSSRALSGCSMVQHGRVARFMVAVTCGRCSGVRRHQMLRHARPYMRHHTHHICSHLEPHGARMQA